jgi:hypothetical protein
VDGPAGSFFKGVLKQKIKGLFSRDRNSISVPNTISDLAGGCSEVCFFEGDHFDISN